jgi:hypothetical protein
MPFNSKILYPRVGAKIANSYVKKVQWRLFQILDTDIGQEVEIHKALTHCSIPGTSHCKINPFSLDAGSKEKPYSYVVKIYWDVEGETYSHDFVGGNYVKEKSNSTGGEKLIGPGDVPSILSKGGTCTCPDGQDYQIGYRNLGGVGSLNCQYAASIEESETMNDSSKNYFKRRVVCAIIPIDVSFKCARANFNGCSYCHHTLQYNKCIDTKIDRCLESTTIIQMASKRIACTRCEMGYSLEMNTDFCSTRKCTLEGCAYCKFDSVNNKEYCITCQPKYWKADH